MIPVEEESELLGNLNLEVYTSMVISSRSTGYAKRFMYEAHAPGKRFNDYREVNLISAPVRV